MVSDRVYKVSYLKDVLTVLSSARLKPYLAKHTREQIPLCSKTDVDFLVEDDQWVVERITGHQEFGRGRNKCKTQAPKWLPCMNKNQCFSERKQCTNQCARVPCSAQKAASAPQRDRIIYGAMSCTTNKN